MLQTLLPLLLGMVFTVRRVHLRSLRLHPRPINHLLHQASLLPLHLQIDHLRHLLLLANAQ
jgi:hypothetical protein